MDQIVDNRLEGAMVILMLSVMISGGNPFALRGTMLVSYVRA